MLEISRFLTIKSAFLVWLSIFQMIIYYKSQTYRGFFFTLTKKNHFFTAQKKKPFFLKFRQMAHEMRLLSKVSFISSWWYTVYAIGWWYSLARICLYVCNGFCMPTCLNLMNYISLFETLAQNWRSRNKFQALETYIEPFSCITHFCVYDGTANSVE